MKTIGQMKEKTIHRQLKEMYSEEAGEIEVTYLDYIVDVVKDHIIYEIQSKNFYNIKEKIKKLCVENKVVLVHPIAVENTIITLNKKGEVIRRRKSPRKGRVENIFDELVSAPEFINEKNLTIQILLISKEEFRIDDGKGSWRRKGISKLDNNLVGIFETINLNGPYDYLRFLSKKSVNFTNKQLASELNISIGIARKITYTLKKASILDGSEKIGREILYKINKF
ncbi:MULTISPECIES: hypothetical protein [Clostridium]|uniref:DUF8091 domain-containing protein n=1 Tax=Clostridium senegalense TaxID=1465809 RepID=A0A6M0H5V4_9CLOT|nr:MULTISPECIES: hypothetical protein [Clostridium]NEU05433.1 hypothetical protein [Clostridium senegalense]